MLLRPSGELLGERIEQRHAGVGIGGDDRIADGVQRHLEPFLAELQGEVGPLQFGVHFLLGREQSLQFFVDAVF